MSKGMSTAALRIASACFCCCILLNITAFYARCENLRGQFLRLHVIAASDSAEDQRLKLKVRDAVLTAGGELFDGSVTAAEAEEKIRPAIPVLQEAAEQVLRANGCEDTVIVTVQQEYFTTRQYGEITLPAGVYEAVKVVIGEGVGQNWWCVMFPPLCLPAAEAVASEDYFSEEDADLLRQPVKYRAKLKIVEWIEQLLS